MNAQATEALQRLLDLAAARAVARGATAFTAEDVLGAADALAAAPPDTPVERRSIRRDGDLGWALSRAAQVSVRNRTWELDVPEVLAELGADPALTNAAAARLAAWIAAEPPSAMHIRAMLVSVEPG
jgi:hypothetical protein